MAIKEGYWCPEIMSLLDKVARRKGKLRKDRYFILTTVTVPGKRVSIIYATTTDRYVNTIDILESTITGVLERDPGLRSKQVLWSMTDET